MTLGEAIERILIESGLSVSAFSRKVGYSRQYIYELIRSKDDGPNRKIQIDTLKRICDASGYSFEKLLTNINYISPQQKKRTPPNTVITVGKSGEKEEITLSDKNFKLVTQMLDALRDNER